MWIEFRQKYPKIEDSVPPRVTLENSNNSFNSLPLEGGSFNKIPQTMTKRKRKKIFLDKVATLIRGKRLTP